MISKDEYLKALETVRKYREQVESEMKDPASLPNADKFLSEFDIPYRLQKILGAIYLYEISRDFKNETEESCYNMIKVSDLKKKPFSIENISRYKGAGGNYKFTIKKIYKGLGVI